MHREQSPYIDALACQALHQCCGVVMAVMPEQLDVRVPSLIEPPCSISSLQIHTMVGPTRISAQVAARRTEHRQYCLQHAHCAVAQASMGLLEQVLL